MAHPTGNGNNGVLKDPAVPPGGKSNAMETDQSALLNTVTTYRVTLELKSPLAMVPIAHESSNVGNQVKNWLVQLFLQNPDTSVYTSSKQKITIPTFPSSEQAVYDLFKYELSRRNNRNVSIILYIETLEKFADIKNPMIEWLKTNQMWMAPHIFDIDTAQKSTIGWILGRNPSETHRDRLKQDLETSFKVALNQMLPPARASFIAKHLPSHSTPDSIPKLEVMVHSSQPTWKLNNKQYKTYAISLTCPRPQKAIIMHLLTEIYPGIPQDEFDESPVYKFIPYSSPTINR